MKRIIFIAIITLSTIASFAQTQQGYVRTAGTAKQKGKPLPDVVIRTSGSSSSVQSNKSGQFTMALSSVKNEGDGFRISCVRKNGYELLDKDALNGDFIYSKSVPIEIVLISTSELIKTRQQIEERARKNATKRYEGRLKELQKQLDKQKITAQEYADKINQLEKQMESFENLIAAMADHYARTDYDKLDSLNKVINECIANGELEKADSLIDTKGDVRKRALENIKKGQHLHEAEVQLDSARQRVNENGEALEEERKRLDKWKEHIYWNSSMNMNNEPVKEIAVLFYKSYCKEVAQGDIDTYKQYFNEFVNRYEVLLSVKTQDSPAFTQGMRGDYILLGANEWSLDKPKSFFSVIDRYGGKRKDILVYDDSGFNKYTFVDRIGARL